MTAPLISVIIPVYNVEEYIDACMASVIHQTYTNLEIILIDDGSTDNSGHICDEYAKSDTRIVVQHQQVIYEDREKLLVDLLLDYVPHAVWGKLYKRDVFGSSRFTKLRMSEDVLIWMDLYSNISKVVFLPLQKYHYVIRPNSLMSYNNFNKNLFDDLIIMEQLRNGLP